MTMPRSLPRKPGRPPKRVPIVRNPNGANEGGNCLGCSNQVRYWYNYQICDHCLTVTRPERNPVSGNETELYRGVRIESERKRAHELL